MKAALGLEFIGCNTSDALRRMSAFEAKMGVKDDPAPRTGPEVLEVYRDYQGEIASQRLYGKRDYSQSNSKGSRGIRLWYTLEMDKIYYVTEPRSWRSVVRYFAAATPDGKVYILSEDEAKEWLSAL